MIDWEREPCTDQALSLRLAPTGDIRRLATIKAWDTVRTEFVQEAGRLASGIVIGVIIARANQSRTPKSAASFEQSYSTRNVLMMVG
jgi:hypothetical protein